MKSGEGIDVEQRYRVNGVNDPPLSRRNRGNRIRRSSIIPHRKKVVQSGGKEAETRVPECPEVHWIGSYSSSLQGVESSTVPLGTRGKLYASSECDTLDMAMSTASGVAEGLSP